METSYPACGPEQSFTATSYGCNVCDSVCDESILFPMGSLSFLNVWSTMLAPASLHPFVTLPFPRDSMHSLARWRFEIVVTLALVSCFCRSTPPGSCAEVWGDDTWVDAARFRLGQIYEEGVFRAPGLQPFWSQDGAKLRIRTGIATDGEPALVWLEAATGEETSPPQVAHLEVLRGRE